MHSFWVIGDERPRYSVKLERIDREIFVIAIVSAVTHFPCFNNDKLINILLNLAEVRQGV